VGAGLAPDAVKKSLRLDTIEELYWSTHRIKSILRDWTSISRFPIVSKTGHSQNSELLFPCVIPSCREAAARNLPCAVFPE
jgi:hypothetical protein